MGIEIPVCPNHLVYLPTMAGTTQHLGSNNNNNNNNELEMSDSISVAAPNTDTSSNKKHVEAMPGDDFETASKRIEEPLDAFGDETNAEIQYKTMSWWQASMGESRQNISSYVI